MKELKICQFPQRFSTIPHLYLDTIQDKQVRYSRSANVIFVRWYNNTWNANKFSKALEESGLSDMVNVIPTDIIKELRKLATVAESRAEKARDFREYQSSIIGDEKCVDTITTLRFLQGARKGGSISSIDGDCLIYYGHPLLWRLGNNEYLLGEEISGGGRNPSAAACRVISTVSTTPGLVLWPSTLNWSTKKEADPSQLVLQWCLKRLKVTQFKRPNATKKTKEAYDFMFKITKATYLKALKRWDTVGVEEIEDLIKLYGDIPKMKEFNNAQRMQFLMEGVK